MSQRGAYEGATLEYITTSDNVRIALHHIGPTYGPTVLLVPGTFSNATYWLGTRGVGFARYLAELGYHAVVLEPRGHGHSGRPGARDRWDFDDWARCDVTSAVAEMTSHEKDVVLVGHSAGGAAIVAALAAHPEMQARVRGLVVVGTPLPWLQRTRGIAARVIRAWAARVDWFPARRLKLGPEDELGGVMAQWMSWNITGRWIGSDGVDYGAGIGNLTVPMLMIAAERDHMWAPPAACRALYDIAGSTDKTFLVCGRQTGFDHDYDHVSILAGKGAQAEVWPLIRNWMTALR